MRIKQKKELMLGELITAAFQAWAASRAEEMVRLAFKTRQVVFQEQPHFWISAAKGRSA
jgi:hypothetical protein